MEEWREKWIAAWRSHQWCCGKRPGLSRLVLLFASDALQYLCHVQLFKLKTHSQASAAPMFHRFDQCRKCLTPVKTIAMPCSFAAAMTSSSRIE